MSGGSWHELHCFDDWGNLSFVSGPSAKALEEGTHRLKFPDGSEKEMRILVRPQGKSIMAYLELHYRGMKMFVGMRDLLRHAKLEIWHADFVSADSLTDNNSMDQQNA